MNYRTLTTKYGRIIRGGGREISICILMNLNVVFDLGYFKNRIWLISTLATDAQFVLIVVCSLTLGLMLGAFLVVWNYESRKKRELELLKKKLEEDEIAAQNSSGIFKAFILLLVIIIAFGSASICSLLTVDTWGAN